MATLKVFRCPRPFHSAAALAIAHLVLMGIGLGVGGGAGGLFLEVDFFHHCPV